MKRVANSRFHQGLIAAEKRTDFSWRLVLAALICALVIGPAGGILPPLTQANATTNSVKSVPVYRMYNPNSGEHFYTTALAELNSTIAAGWRYEGTLEQAPTSGSPVYRIFNPNATGATAAGSHFYTSSKSEAQSAVNQGWKWDNARKPVFYSGGAAKVYVAWNRASGSHNYTTAIAEQNQLTRLGWVAPTRNAPAWLAVGLGDPGYPAPVSLTNPTILARFRRSSIPSGSAKVPVKKPNVIVIFTEGLSGEVLDINNNKGYNLTPNLDRLSSQTISFNDYFNQTAVTFPGVRCQLYSCQQNINDQNLNLVTMKNVLKTRLVSLQQVLGARGYNTEFIQTEPFYNDPKNTWPPFVDSLGFGKVYSLPDRQLVPVSHNSYRGTERIVNDQKAYSTLMSQATSLRSKGKPFFLSIYTFQTHQHMDTCSKSWLPSCTDVPYGSKKNPWLNKFHNMDNAFGKFWTAFRKSPLAKNTVVVFTADHATFPEQGYNSLFNTGRTYIAAPVPLMIWYPGVQPRKIDVGGKNSTSLTPTILDLLGDNNVTNYFLGNSLFAPQTSDMQYVTTVPGIGTYWTKGITQADTMKNKQIVLNNPALQSQLNQYYSIATN